MTAVKLLEEARNYLVIDEIAARQMGYNHVADNRKSLHDRIDALLKTGGWKCVIERPNSVAWIDDQAEYVGMFRDGKRYVFSLPPLPETT